MMNIDELISDLTGDNTGNSTNNTNESERDGNAEDLLFRFEQAGLNIQGGATSTLIAPYTAVQDLLNGNMTKGAWLALAAFAAIGYWLLRKH